MSKNVGYSRRQLLRWTATAAGGTALAACGSGSESGDASGPLNVICTSDFQPLVEHFAKQYRERTGTEVRVTAQAYNQTHDKIVAALAGGRAPYDVVVVDSIWTAEFAAAGFLAPLDEYLPGGWAEQLVPAALESRSWDGKVYQWPMFTMKYLYYNAGMLERAGIDRPPATWEELVSMSQVIQGRKIASHGTAWAMSQAEGLVCDYAALLHGFGGNYRDPAGGWTVNQAGGLDAIEFMIDTLYGSRIADPASTTLDDRTNRELFASGQIPFLVNWTSAYRQFTTPSSSRVVDDVRIGLVPAARQANRPSASVTGGSGFGIVARSKRKEAAWQFLTEMLAGEEAQRHWLKEANQLPTLRSLYDDPAVRAEYPHLAQMRTGMDHGVSRPQVPWYSEASLTLQIELNAAATRQKSPREAIDAANARLNELQKQHG